MTTKKILVTGGAGFIGSHLTDHLLAIGYQVTVIDNLVNGNLNNLSEAKKNQNFTFVHGDILDKQLCIDVAKDCAFIFHLACLGVRHSIHSPFENHRVNAEGTLNVLEAANKIILNTFSIFLPQKFMEEPLHFP